MLSRQRFNSCCGCFFGRLFQPAAVFVGAEAGELFEGAGKVTAVGIADEVDDIADLQAGVGQQLLGLFDADGVEQIVIALLRVLVDEL